MNVGANFNNYDFKAAIINFVQIFLIGWLVVGLLLFLWSATSEYGFEKTVNDMSIDLFLSPIFWLFPLMVAGVVGFMRGVKRENFDIRNPEQLDAYFESQKLSNQPLWFKIIPVLLVLIFAYALLKPDSEITQKQYRIIKNELDHVKSPELNAFYAIISEDGKIMGKEFHNFINMSMKEQFGKATE